MALSKCQMLCVQYVYFFINYVFVICGTFLIIMASVIEQVPEEYRMFTNWDNEAIVILKSIGICLIILSFLANLTSIKQTFMLFSIYGGLIIVLLTVILNFGFRVHTIKNTSTSVVRNNMLASLRFYYFPAKNNWDYMQHYLECCGVQNVSDWEYFAVDGPEVTIDGKTYTIPYSCCTDFYCSKVHPSGCLNILDGYISTITLTILWFSASLGIIKILVVLFTSVFVIFLTTENDAKTEGNEPIPDPGTPLEPLNIEDLNRPSTSFVTVTHADIEV